MRMVDMKKKGTPYLKQKFRLYFDENFPQDVVEVLETDSHWRRKCKIYSAYNQGFEKEGDKFHFEYCIKNNLVLVTLDKDFMDDSKYPFSKIPGIVRIVARKNDSATILANLSNLLIFLSFFPLPRYFMKDTKFEVRSNGCIIRGRDSMTHEIRSVTVKTGDTANKVMKSFRYI
jgi:predicted nuclease of predicted toxin-antitoxin system